MDSVAGYGTGMNGWCELLQSVADLRLRLFLRSFENMVWRSGEASVAVAAMLFSIGNLAVGVTCKELPVLEVSAFIATGGILLVFLSVLKSGQSMFASDSQTASLAALRALLGASTTICYYCAIQLCGLRDSTALFFTSPLWTLMFECMARKRLPGAATAFGALTTALGALLISQRCFCLVFNYEWLDDYCPQDEDPEGPLLAGRTLLALFSAKEPLDDDVARQLLGMGIAVIAAISNSCAFLAIRAIGGKLAPMPLALWCVIMGIISCFPPSSR